MTELQSRFFEVGELRLHALEAGEGPPVLFLHGWPTHAGLWRHVLAAVAPHRRAIALDLPGFGKSDKPDLRYSFRFFDGVLDGALEALGVEGPVGLVVHDLGGPVGLHWAVQRADRISELALLNTLVFSDLSVAVKAFVTATRVPGVRSVLGSRFGVAQSMKFGVVDKSRMTPELLASYTEPYATPAARKALLAAGHGLSVRRFPVIEENLHRRADIPARIVFGQDDRILPEVSKTMARVVGELPQARVTMIPDCGHFLQEDQPDVVAAALAAFFADHDPGPLTP